MCENQSWASSLEGIMSRIVGAAFALAMLVLSALPAAAADGATVLTVTGDIAKTNRGAFDAFHDGFLNYHGKTFDKAFEFDENALQALPQQQVTANAEPWKAAIAMTGPLLSDVLAAAGATGKPITVFALDGYGAAMTPEQIAAHPWVLATHADGVALGIGGRGPLWLVYDTGTGKASAQEEGAWMWSVFHIQVGE
jgi:hypothetical protein